MGKRFVLSTGKLLLYIIGKLLAVAIIAAAVVFAWLTAMNSMNINVVAKDAFAKRNSVILEPLENENTALLPKLFTEEYLEKSHLDTQRANASYVIANYDERITIPFAIILPWQDEAEIEVQNIVQDVKAKVSTTLAYNPVEEFIESGRYKVSFTKVKEGSWKVSDIELIEEIVPESVLPVPTPEPSADTSEGGEEEEGYGTEGEGNIDEDETE